MKNVAISVAVSATAIVISACLTLVAVLLKAVPKRIFARIIPDSEDPTQVNYKSVA